MTKPRWWISLLVTGLGLLTLRVNAAPTFLPAELVRGDDALASGKPSLALSAYQPLTEHPAALRLATLRIAQAQMTLARQENSAAAFTAACAAWLDVVRFEGFSTQVRRHLAECKLGQGDSLGAAHEWEQVVAVESDDASFWALLAPAHLAHEEWDAAGRAYRALAQAEPANTEYRYWAGLLNLSTNPAVARQDLLAAKSDPLYLKRAGTLLAAIELAELDSGRLGLVYLSVGEPGLALPYLQEAGRENDNAAIWAYLGLAQDQLGKNGYAALARALELDPDSPVAHSLMGRHWQRLGRPDLARPEYVNAWQLDPDNPALLADVAAAYEAEGDAASAEAWYQAAVRRAPDNVDFWILLSRFYLNSGPGELGNGLLAAQKAVALEPENPAALDALGWAQLQAGEFSRTETNLLAARDRAPGDPAVYYHLGELYRQSGEQDQAIAAFETAVRLDQPCRGCRPPVTGTYAELAQRSLGNLGY